MRVRHDRPLAFGGGGCFVMSTFLRVTHPASCCREEIAEVQIETTRQGYADSGASSAD